jgi:tripartite ATP-independent transporter DctM subunit
LSFENDVAQLKPGLAQGAAGQRRFAAIAHAGLDAVHETARTLAAVGLVGELLVVFFGVVSRSLFSYSFVWGGDLSQIALAIIAFVGGAVAYREMHHTCVSVVKDALPAGVREAATVATDWIVFFASAVACYTSLDMVGQRWGDLMPSLQVSTAWTVLPLSVGMALIALYSLERLAAAKSRRVVAVGGIVIGTFFVALVATGAAPFFANNLTASLVVMLLVFFATVLLGLPVSFAMIVATLLYLRGTGAAELTAVPLNMIDGSTSNFILLALPFFIFAGMIMEKGGISLRLIRFAMMLVGHLRGGLLQVMVVTIYLVSGISGSKAADVAAVGLVMREELKKRNYPPEEGAAVLAASAAMAETIPPSIGMLVLGSVTPISIGTLFIAGLLPAMTIAICLMLLIYLKALREPPKVPVAAAPTGRAATAAGALLPLTMPIMMVVGIRFGIATPTEVSAFAVAYGVVLAAGIYREMKFRQVWRVAMECAVTAGMVLFVISAAGSFAWVLTAADLAHGLMAAIHAGGGGRAVFLLESIFILIVLGSLLEGLPAIIILAPLLLPIALQQGIDPVQYGILLLLSMGVGAFMPPLGVGFYVACAVADSKMEGAARRMIPYLIVLVLAVILIAFFPEITLVLPRLFAG